MRWNKLGVIAILGLAAWAHFVPVVTFLLDNVYGWEIAYAAVKGLYFIPSEVISTREVYLAQWQGFTACLAIPAFWTGVGALLLQNRTVPTQSRKDRRVCWAVCPGLFPGLLAARPGRSRTAGLLPVGGKRHSAERHWIPDGTAIASSPARRSALPQLVRSTRQEPAGRGKCSSRAAAGCRPRSPGGRSPCRGPGHGGTNR